MSHTHHYSFWHAHEHYHELVTDAPGEMKLAAKYTSKHNTGHYHNWMQTHDHGAGGKGPHTHKARQYHEENDPETKHHHALDAHDNEPEHHPECKLPYYGGGLKGCIDQCESGKKEAKDVPINRD